MIRNKAHGANGQLHINDTAIVVIRNTAATVAETNSANLPENDSVEGMQQRRRRRIVSFNNSVQVRPTIHFCDYTDEEMEQCWYTRQEYAEISVSCSKQIAKMENGKILKDKKYCQRGLEKHTTKASLERSILKQTLTQAVLQIQYMCWKNDLPNSDVLIGQVSTGISKECRLRAAAAAAAAQRR